MEYDFQKEKARMTSQKIASTIRAGEAARAQGTTGNAAPDEKGEGFTAREALRIGNALQLIEKTRAEKPEALARLEAVYRDVFATIRGETPNDTAASIGWTK